MSQPPHIAGERAMNLHVTTAGHGAGATQRPANQRSAGRASLHVVRAGFIPLVDVAVLVAARQQGFAAREGIDLHMTREVSWSNIRDRLAVRQFDVAHMLSPMTVASQLGIGTNPAPCFTPFVLSRGGNAITLSTQLYRDMQQLAGLTGTEDALCNVRALARVIGQRRQAGDKPLVFAMTYPFSSHNYEFRFWLAAGGVDPDRDVTMTVVPPPLTTDALSVGAIDGFCVNAPWNAMAVERGVGRIVATKRDIWPSSPEKVLGVNPDWADRNPDTLARLIVALDAAARWCDRPENHSDLAGMLAEPDCIGAERGLIKRLLRGELIVDPDGTTRQIESYLTCHADGGNFPWISQARWIYSQMIRWRQTSYDPAHLARVDAACRPDLYRAMLAGSVSDMPSIDSHIEGISAPSVIPANGGPLTLPAQPFLDGRSFDPDDVPAYLQGFPIGAKA